MHGPFDAAADANGPRCPTARARACLRSLHAVLPFGRRGGGGGCSARRKMDTSLQALPPVGAPGVVTFVHVHVHCYEGAGAPTHSVTTRVVGAAGAGLLPWTVHSHLPRRQPARPRD